MKYGLLPTTPRFCGSTGKSERHSAPSPNTSIAHSTSSRIGLLLNGWGGLSGQLFEGDRRVVEEDPRATLAAHHLVALFEVLKELRPQRHVAHRAAPVDGLGDRNPAARLAHALVALVTCRRHLLNEFSALR